MRNEGGSLFQFRRRYVAGVRYECCGTPKQVEKVFAHRSDHPDGENGSFTSFTPDDMKVFVREAGAYIGLDVTARLPFPNHVPRRLRVTPKPGESTVFGLPYDTILDLIDEAKRERRLW